MSLNHTLLLDTHRSSSALGEESHLSDASAAIQHCRQVALSILKPSHRDLEVGLALHREALVAESYSLGLQATPNIETLEHAINAGASSSELKDAIEEQRALNWIGSPNAMANYRQAWEAAGVNCMFLNAGEESNDPLVLIKRLARYTHLIDSMPDFLARAIDARQIEVNHAEGKYSLCFSFNGIPLAGRHLNVEDEMSYIRTFFQLGVRMMHLTYNRRNPLGDGCGEAKDGGLSDFGHCVVKEMNRLGIIIDLSHTGWQTCRDVAKATSQPVIVSHSAAHALNAHIRCKPDDVIKAIIDTGGTMGITNVPPFLGGAGDISTFLDHIDYVVKKFGSDAVTIGTDHSYRLPDGDAWAAKIPSRPRSRTQWEKLWPASHLALRTQWQTPEMVESLSWTNWPLFTVGLIQRGHSETNIRKILGGNLLRVVDAVCTSGGWQGCE